MAGTVRAGLARAVQRLEHAGIDEARLDAQLLLGAALARSRAWLLAHAHDPLAPESRERIAALVARRAAGEPIAYILGRREFWSLDIAVSPSVLIPRPDTECLVECALRDLPAARTARICDAGTGSGAVAIALALERPAAELIATDASAEALAVAAGNVSRLAPGRVRLLRADWLRALAGHCVDVVVANPPYVREDDPHLRTGDLRFEPRAALAAGSDGLQAIRTLAAQATQCLREGGRLLLEHGAEQGPAVRALLLHHGFHDVHTHRDLAGRERVTAASR